MKTTTTAYNRSEKLIVSLCDEIDEWKEAAAYWQKMYETERNERNAELNERLEQTKIGIGQALVFALSVKDNEDGSLSISKENRKMLAEMHETSKG